MAEPLTAVDQAVFPAHAGMSPHISAGFIDPGCFPRTRGDEPSRLGQLDMGVAFSPHTRG